MDDEDEEEEKVELHRICQVVPLWGLRQPLGTWGGARALPIH